MSVCIHIHTYSKSIDGVGAGLRVCRTNVILSFCFFHINDKSDMAAKTCKEVSSGFLALVFQAIPYRRVYEYCARPKFRSCDMRGNTLGLCLYIGEVRLRPQLRTLWCILPEDDVLMYWESYFSLTFNTGWLLHSVRRDTAWDVLLILSCQCIRVSKLTDSQMHWCGFTCN